jgi:hypothetical protein
MSLCLVLPAILGFSLGLTVLLMAQNDLARMGAGLLDPEGKEKAVMASLRAMYGVILCFFCWIPLVVYSLLELAQTFRRSSLF